MGLEIMAMSALRNLNIKAKLTLIAVTTSAAALLCVLLAFVLQDLRLVKRVKAEQVESQLSILVGNLANAIVQSDLATVGYLLKNGSSAHGIIAATVFDRNGKVLSQYPVIAGKLTPIPSAEGFDFQSRTLQRPIIWRGNRVGQVEVQVSYSDVQMRMVYMGVYAMVAFLLAVVIAVGVAWLVQKIISDPLLSLHGVSQKVFETGDYSLRAEIRSGDELGQLGEAFNRMLSQIEQRDLMMEKQVSQRTRELQKLAEEFRYRALHDTLTGLPNRALLNEEFNRAAAHANRTGKQFAVLLLDLDNFKIINDSYGHEIGDELLKMVSNKIRAALRAEDIVCRLGGDEFIVLLEGVENVDHIHSVGESLLLALQNELWVSGRPLRIGVSIGASFYPQHGKEINELKRNADIAMYCAKGSGKHQLVVFEDTLAKTNSNKLTVQSDLLQAIARRELELHFQPQIDVIEQRLVGCEVLVRWRHSGLGMMQPADFIPLAEENGAIRQVDYYVLREACRQAQKWRLDFALQIPISVNLASQHFLTMEIIEEVRSVLRETQLPAAMLTLEFTESVLLDDSSMANNVAKSLRQLGVKLALGGFGAGFCSLAHLRMVNLDCIKLDRSLYRGIQRENGERRVTKGLVAFAKELGVELVAEGVERVEQIQVLQQLGCRVMQGFAYSKPVAQSDFLAWIKRLDCPTACVVGESV